MGSKCVITVDQGYTDAIHKRVLNGELYITILHELLQCISKHTTLFDQTNLFRDTVWATLQWKSRKTDKNFTNTSLSQYQLEKNSDRTGTHKQYKQIIT